MNILLLSAYDALSHQYWHKGLMRAFPEYDYIEMREAKALADHLEEIGRGKEQGRKVDRS